MNQHVELWKDEELWDVLQCNFSKIIRYIFMSTQTRAKDKWKDMFKRRFH